MYISLQGLKLMSKGVRRVAGRIRVSYNQRERLSSAFRGTGLGRRVMKSGRNQVPFCLPVVYVARVVAANRSNAIVDLTYQQLFHWKWTGHLIALTHCFVFFLISLQILCQLADCLLVYLSCVFKEIHYS